MNIIQEVLREIKKELSMELNNRPSAGGQGLQEQLWALDSLVREGRLDEAQLTWETLEARIQDILRLQAPQELISPQILLNLKARLQEKVAGKIDGMIRPGLMGLLGPIGGPLATLGGFLLRNFLDGRSYRRSNLPALVTPENRNMLTRVIAFCTKVEARHRVLPGSSPATLQALSLIHI